MLMVKSVVCPRISGASRKALMAAMFATFVTVIGGCAFFCEMGVGDPIVDIPVMIDPGMSFEQAVKEAAYIRHWDVEKVDENTFRLRLQRIDICQVEVKRTGNRFSILPIKCDTTVRSYNRWTRNLQLAIVNFSKRVSSKTRNVDTTGLGCRGEKFRDQCEEEWIKENISCHVSLEQICQARTNAWHAEWNKWMFRHNNNRFVSVIPKEAPAAPENFKKCKGWQSIGYYDYARDMYDLHRYEISREMYFKFYNRDHDGFLRFRSNTVNSDLTSFQKFSKKVEAICEKEIRAAYLDKLELDLLNAVDEYKRTRTETDRGLIAGIFNEYPELYATSAEMEIASRKFMDNLPSALVVSRGREVSGTAWFVASNKIVTCEHVVRDARSIKVEMVSGASLEGRVIAKDKNFDIAVLEVNGASSIFLPVLSADEKLATKVFTVGYPMPGLLGKDQKYTEGTISSLSGLGDDRFEYQVSIPFQPGNSGGAVVNENGLVVGIASAVLDSAKGFEIGGVVPQNVNYAVKSYCLALILKDAGVEFSEDAIGKENAVDHVSKATVLLKAIR